MTKGQIMLTNSQNKKEIFSEFRKQIFNGLNEIKLSSLTNKLKIINEFKSIKVIELDDLDTFESYVNYDHFLIFKNDNNYYFCDIELVPGLKKESLVKILDYNQYLRKDKIKKIQDENSID